MILKRLYEEYDLAIERILFKEYKRLKLTMHEMQVLLALFSIHQKRKTFSLNAISRRMDLNMNEIAIHVQSLLKKNFIRLELETYKDQEREIFDLDLTFQKIEALYLQDEKENNKTKVQNEVQNTIESFEKALGRLLKNYELETIRNWYEQNLYTEQQIKQAMQDAGTQIGVKHVERLLTQIALKPIEIDEKVEQVLDNLFKKIK